MSKEGDAFTVPANVAKMSELVKSMIDEEEDDDSTPEIPLPNVKGVFVRMFVKLLFF